MPVSDKTFERIALEDPEGKWELYCGQLQSKEPMRAAHNQTARILGFRLQQQLPLDQYEVSVDLGHLRRPGASYFIPDVMVIPVAAVQRRKQEQPNGLESYVDPLPLVVEIWSPSTGKRDLQVKVPEYQRRGDAEIWLLHRRNRRLTSLQRQSDGRYTETVYRAGRITPVALPDVAIDLDELFNL